MSSPSGPPRLPEVAQDRSGERDSQQSRWRTPHIPPSSLQYSNTAHGEGNFLLSVTSSAPSRPRTGATGETLNSLAGPLCISRHRAANAAHGGGNIPGPEGRARLSTVSLAHSAYPAAELPHCTRRATFSLRDPLSSPINLSPSFEKEGECTVGTRAS